MVIRTKIVATVGPATTGRDILRRLAEAGCDVFRINFSHGSEQQRVARLANIRAVEAEFGRPLAVMADLCGPKIRVGNIAGDSAGVTAGREIVIQRRPIDGRADRICTTLAELVDKVTCGEAILIDDGRIRLEVLRAAPPDEVVCRVVRGGTLRSGAGVNLPNTTLAADALTEKDRQDVAWIVRQDFDYVALSFVRSAGDVASLRKLLDRADCGARIVAKIEKPQAVENIGQIIDASDAVMVARGDLGVEMDLPAVPVAQKRITRLCQAAGKPCIIATQMLESMTHAAVPTRAEVSDVANAVLDHADAVMLSGETAVGQYPVQAVATMNEIVAHTQAYHDETFKPMRVTYGADRTTAALAGAVREIMTVENIAAVAVYTASGATALVLAKNRLGCPILAIAAEAETTRRMCLYYGVTAAVAPAPEHTRDLLAIASKFALQRNLAQKGDKIVVTSGRPIGKPGTTNTLVVHTIE